MAGVETGLPRLAHTIRDIAQALSSPFEGDGDLGIGAASEPATASGTDLAVAMYPKYAGDVKLGDSQAAILWEGADWRALGLKAAIFVSRPRLAMAKLTGHLKGGETGSAGIHPSAVIDTAAEIGKAAQIGAFVVIGANVRIGANAKIDAHVTIGPDCKIGDGCMLGSGTHIGANVSIGDNFATHSGAAIGGDGFSFVTAEKNAVENVRETLGDSGTRGADQDWQKIHSLGGVEIGDNVEIGSNSSVDAGTIRPTRIGDGSKLDALVQVGHNVIIGRNCLLCGHVGVGGSARLGDGVVLGGQAGVADNITIGDGVIAGGASKILSNVPAGRAILGYPAVKMETQLAIYKSLRRLPAIMQKLATTKKPVSKDETTD